MIRIACFFGAAAALLALAPTPASAATLTANVSISTQTMTVMHRGAVVGRWPVSTARRGKVTPTGSWSAKWLSRNHRSSRYDGAPMPYFIRFRGGIGMHAGYLPGYPASHGCVRLPKDMAAHFYHNVEPGTPVDVVN